MRILLTFCLCLSVVAGCGGPPSDMPPLGDVSGKVTLGGKPLAGVLVEFRPQESGRPSTATTDDEGYYTLQYTTDYSGAAVGKHSIYVTPVEEETEDYSGDYSAGGNGDDDSFSQMPPAATDGSLTFEVKEGSNEKNIDL